MLKEAKMQEGGNKFNHKPNQGLSVGCKSDRRNSVIVLLGGTCQWARTLLVNMCVEADEEWKLMA